MVQRTRSHSKSFCQFWGCTISRQSRSPRSKPVSYTHLGCRTGFYLLTRGLTPAEALELTVESFRFMAGFEGAVPGASEVECGNYRDMDLPAAKAEAAAMLPVLEALTGDCLLYTSRCV